MRTAFLVHAFSVGRRTCTLSVPTPRAGEAITMRAEWAPDVPARLSDGELRQYRSGRDAALRALGRLLRRRVAVVES